MHLAAKYPDLGQRRGWFWVFPAAKLSVDPPSRTEHRHHAYEEPLRRPIKLASAAAQIFKPVAAYRPASWSTTLPDSKINRCQCLQPDWANSHNSPVAHSNKALGATFFESKRCSFFCTTARQCERQAPTPWQRQTNPPQISTTAVRHRFMPS